MHGKNGGVNANISNRNASIELFMECPYFQLSNKNINSDVAIFMVNKPMKGLGLSNRAK